MLGCWRSVAVLLPKNHSGNRPRRAVDGARIVFDCRTTDDSATIASTIFGRVMDIVSTARAVGRFSVENKVLVWP